jgi:leucyl/phenylalanyl-tRNA---protein transferase
MGEDDLVGVGLDLEPATLVAAYRAGLFPMRLAGRRGALGWWSPDPRGILPLERLRVTRSLARSCRRYRVTFDTDFDAVVAGCADRRRPGGWIGPDIRAAYGRLARLGVARSVEVRDGRGVLVGGLYGVCLGGLFAGESMFHRQVHGRDASKVALVALVRALRQDGVAGRLLDVQWSTPHLASLGAVEVPRSDYLALLARALALPAPAGMAAPAAGGQPPSRTT